MLTLLLATIAGLLGVGIALIYDPINVYERDCDCSLCKKLLKEGESVKLTKRGKRARAIVLILFALYATIQVSANLWFTESGYCWGSYDKCYQLEGENK